MTLLENVLLLGIGLFFLAKSAEIVIAKGAALARFLRVSELAIGFILVSIATTIPELAVSLSAAASGHTELVVGNVFGSNIANLSLILGAAAIVGHVAVQRYQIQFLIRLLTVLVAVPLILLAVSLGRLTGFLLLIAYLAFAYFALQKKIRVDHSLHLPSRTAVRDAALLFLAGIVLAVSAKAVVSSSAFIAETIGLTEAFIGATIIAVGTSLPELTVSLQAVTKRHPQVALGNLLGASITNITLNLGLATLINPLVANLFIVLDLVVFSIVVNGALWFFLESGRLGKNQGITLAAIFLVYVLSLLVVELAT